MMSVPRRLAALVTAAAAGAAAVVVAAAPAGALTTHQPSITTDELDGDHSPDDLSLREAFSLAQQDGDASVIQLAAGATYQLQCIGTGEGPLGHSPSGGPEPLRVEGNGAVIEQTCPGHRVLSVVSSDFELDDVTVTGGDALDNGGGIQALGTVTVSDSRIEGNVNQGAADNGGGGIMAQGDVTVVRSVVAGNRANRGGAIATVGGGSVTVVDSSIIGNESTATTTAISSGATVDLVNSTVTGNEGPGAAVSSSGDVDLRHATVVANTATNTGFTSRALYVLGDLSSFASVVAANATDTGGCYVQGTTTASSYSIEGDTTCGFTNTAEGDQQAVTATDLRIGPGRDNGGPGTPTMYPLWGSPLVDAVPAPSCDATLTADQRGIARPYGTGCDIGATERVYPPHGLTDVPAWVDDAVAWITSDVNDPPIMTGYADLTFRPNLSITRAQVVRLLYREAGSPPVGALPPHGFTDVPAWVEDAVRWAKAGGIMTGMTATTFVPDDPITRAQVARAKYRLAGEPPVAALPPHGFADVPAWVEDAVRWARGHDLVTGMTATTFVPDDPITRAQVARMDHRLALSPDAWADPGSAPATLPFRPDA